ncbi:MAG: peptidase domain-containing ABC transporter [Candidatus Paceibacterota bacterium]
MLKRFPIQLQHDSMDCGAACLTMISAHYGLKLTQDSIRELCHTTRIGVSMLSISHAAEQLGFRTVGGRIPLSTLLEKRPLPCILHWNHQHFVVLHRVSHRWFSKGNSLFHIADPAFGNATFTEEEVRQHWANTVNEGQEKGLVLLLEPTRKFFVQKNDEPVRRGLGMLLSYFRRYRSYFVQMALGLLFGSLLQLIFPFLTQAIVDIGIGNRNLSFIYVVLLAQAMLIISRTVIDYIRRWLLLHVSVRINLSLVSDFLIKLLKLPMGYFDTRRSGDILQRMADHERVELFITSRSLQTVFSFFSLITFGAVLLYYSVKIFAIFLLGSIIYAGWVTIFLKQRRLLDYKFFNRRSQNQSTTYQLIAGMQEIKLQGCTNRKRYEWEDIQVDLLELHTEALKLEQRREAGNILINEGKNMIITIMAATAVISGEMTLGMMLATQYIIGQLALPIEQAVHFTLDLQDVKISLDRINEIHIKEEEVHSSQSVITNFSGGSIDIHNLSFRYDGPTSTKVLDGVNISIPQGKVTAIVGYSGSGKTTLLKLILSYYSPSEGSIFVNGNNLATINSNWWREQCGAVMQDGFIFSESIARNIATADGEIDTRRLAMASKMANIYDTVMGLPLKFNTMIGQEGQGLSHGQRQRLLIARAVYRNPYFLFFDEATNALDANNERVIVENLQEFYQGKTVVIVAHRLSTVKNADQIVVLADGKVAEIGNHQELTEKRGAYFQLVKNQLDLGY